jgi:hypothetical protein
MWLRTQRTPTRLSWTGFFDTPLVEAKGLEPSNLLTARPLGWTWPVGRSGVEVGDLWMTGPCGRVWLRGVGTGCVELR